MSDLVGNPEDRFSRVVAHIEIFKLNFVSFYSSKDLCILHGHVFVHVFVIILLPISFLRF